MRRLSVLAAAAAACLLFTACPNKPTDEPVTIPDGLYEETAYYQTHDVFHHPDKDTTMYRTLDTVYRTTVAIVGGDFIYPDLCSDSIKSDPNLPTIFYNHFIWQSRWYCREKRIPAHTNGDGYVYFDNIRLRNDLSSGAEKYNLRVPIVRHEGFYTLDYEHRTTTDPYATRTISISDTLRLL